MSAQTSLQGMEDDLLSNAEPCPFCDCDRLHMVNWSDDDGDYLVIECVMCKGCAPAGVWNQRSGAGVQLPQEISDAIRYWNEALRRKQ